MPRTIPKKLAYVFDNSPFMNNPDVDKMRKKIASEVLAKRVKQTRNRVGCEPKQMAAEVRNKRYHHACAPRRSVAEAEAILTAALRSLA